MVRYDPKSWIDLILHSYSKQIFKTLVPAQVFIGVYTFLLVLFIRDVFGLQLQSTTLVHSLLGIVLGLYMVFRTNSAYDRWWEGRVTWGKLVNDLRNLALKVHTAIGQNNSDDRQALRKLLTFYPFVLKEHLRRKPNYDFPEFQELVETEEFQKADHKPNAVIGDIFDRIGQMRKDSKIDDYQYLAMDPNLNGLADVLGACERIRNTPIPYSYSMFLKKFIFLYLSTLPFAFLGDFGYWTILIVIMILYILMGTELIAEEIEDPFGRDKNDLPTDQLAEKIKVNIDEILK